jgi:hypothetical protein
MVYGHPNNAQLIYVGAGTQVFVRTTMNGNLTPTTAAFPGDMVFGVAVDPADQNIVYAIGNASVFQTVNGGANWTDITGNITADGAGSFRAIAYIPSVTADRIVVGTNAGVFVSFEGSFGTWFKLGSELPNAPVWDLDYDAADDVLVAGLLGRGAWLFSGAAEVALGRVTSFTGRAHGVGMGAKTAGVAIIGIFTFDGAIDLSAFPATVTLTSLFNEVGGAGEVVANLPLTLLADSRNNANVARFNTPVGTLPIAKVTIGAKGGGRFTFRVDVAKATIVPPSCPTTNLTTSFTIHDGFNPLFPSVTVTTLQPWRCFGAGNKYLKSPPP